MIEAPADEVFEAICDPATLMAIIPGCTGIQQVGDEYRGEFALRLPGFAGSCRTTVRLTESARPSHGRIAGEASGGFGSIRGDATFDLAEDAGRTTVRYAGRATITGPLAGLDNRFAEGVASSLIGQGLDALGARLRARRHERDGAPA